MHEFVCMKEKERERERGLGGGGEWGSSTLVLNMYTTQKITNKSLFVVSICLFGQKSEAGAASSFQSEIVCVIG